MTKEQLTVAAVQFEMTEDDKAANLDTMFGFIDRAAEAGADIVSFQEICVSGYDYLFEQDREKLLEIAEDTHDGPTIRAIHEKAKQTGVVVAFGMLEKTPEEQMFNTYVICTPEKGNIFQHRKVHAFENSEISMGDSLEVFELFGWTMGVLICYDNNLPENPRVLALKGAELIFAPHQTGGFDINSSGMGKIDLDVWRNRHKDPVRLKQEIEGPKGYQWITKWLPSRPYDNNCFYIFTNGVGIDGPEVRVGCSMILNPEGIILAETKKPGDDMIVSVLDRSAREGTIPSGHIAARRPALYDKIVEPVEEIDTRTARNRLSGHTIR